MPKGLTRAQRRFIPKFEGARLRAEKLGTIYEPPRSVRVVEADTPSGFRLVVKDQALSEGESLYGEPPTKRQKLDSDYGRSSSETATEAGPSEHRERLESELEEYDRKIKICEC